MTSAILHLTARGVITAHLQGREVSDDVLSPGWTSYEWRLRYRSHDVTALLSDDAGPVVLGVELGNGWYRGRLGWSGHRAVYGTERAALAQLELEFSDGHRQVIGTDTSWRSGPSPVLADDLYDGQTIDARRVDDSWLRPGSDTTEWGRAREVDDFDAATLTPHPGPPVRRQETVRPQRIWLSPSGRTLVDFGRNIVGWVRCRVRGERGSALTLRHAEVLENGELGTRPLRSALATDRFILSGDVDEFEPTSTFHGFRYLELVGWPGTPSADALEAVVIRSDLRRIGTFSCSDELLNQLHRNVVHGTEGNFVDLPTDCPQRDERLGWTGDIAVFAPTAAFLFDCGTFLQDWLADLATEQQAAGGRVPHVIPDALKFIQPTELSSPTSAALWSDAAVWVPWALWQAYGDRQALIDSYPSMAMHVRHVEGLLSANGLWDSGFQFGDWLDPDAPPDDPARAKADAGVVATACAHRSARLVADTATLLGHHDDARHFETLAAALKSAFAEHYLSADGTVRSDAPTVYALALCFGLIDDGTIRQRAGDRLAQLVSESGHHISTGFAGTPFITDALTIAGHLEDAYRLLLQQECPSWLYPVTMGATTVWERWDSMLPDGSVNPGEMTSFNHYALGAVADWMHRVIGGISPAEPGYRRVRIAPRPGGGIRWASIALESPQGRISVDWRLSDSGELALDIALPQGVVGVLDLPGTPLRQLTAGRHELVVDR